MKKKCLHVNIECPNMEKCSHEASCFFCIMKEQRPGKKHARLAKLFSEMPLVSEEEQVLVMSALWNVAMAHPNDPEFLKLGILECMTGLIRKGLRDRRWLLRDQNVYIPYYATHIIGSYTMNVEEFAKKAVEAGVIPPLVELLRGRMTWVEQRVAVRALGHLCSYESTFLAVAACEYVVELAMDLSSCCLDIVYTQFISRSSATRLRYHCDLLTRGMGGTEMQNRKAEEWASQLQCWTLHLINCFAQRGKCLPVICNPGFLNQLPDMWGGLVNENSPAGVGLLRNLCYHKVGRSSIAESDRVLDCLCNVARSSDDWQYMAIESLLLLLQDRSTRQKAIEKTVVALADLAEMESLGDVRGVGHLISEILLRQCQTIKRVSPVPKKLLDELQDIRRRQKWERSMSKEDLYFKKAASMVAKLEGNSRFSAGDLRGALRKYTEALALCPVQSRKERLILYSNRAQCHLLLENPNSAISDTTRALALSHPVNSHSKSLWRRAQAYEMKGLAKESLLDAIMFINESSISDKKFVKVPYYAVEMVKKQMQAAWLFKAAAEKNRKPTACNQNKSKLYIPPSPSSSLSSSDVDADEDEESEWETVNDDGEGLEECRVETMQSPKHVEDLVKNQKACEDESEKDNQLHSSSFTAKLSGSGLGSMTPINYNTNQDPTDSGGKAMCLPTIKEETVSDEDRSQVKVRGSKHKIFIVKNRKGHQDGHLRSDG